MASKFAHKEQIMDKNKSTLMIIAVIILMSLVVLSACRPAEPTPVP
jgi:hypothetical protein